MFKNKKIIIILGLSLVALFAFLYFRKRNKDAEEGVQNSVASGSAAESSSGLPVATFPLRPQSQVGEYSAAKGSYGQQIAELQKLCNKKYGAGLDIDGKWGPKTDEVFRSRLGTLLFPGGISEAQYKVFLNQ